MTEFRVEYSYGRGSFVMDLDEILPASASNMKRIRSVIDMDENPVEKAQELHEYIVSRVEELKKRRGVFLCADRKADCTAKIKTLIADNDSLVKTYGVESITDEEVVKAKKHDVYALVLNEMRQAEIRVYTGKIFVKYGRTFTAYKDENGYWKILLPETGMACDRSVHKTFNKAVADLDDVTNMIISHYVSGTEYAKTVEIFRNRMVEDGYGDMLTADEFQMETTVENEAPVEIPASVEEAPVDADAAEIPAPMENTAPVENVTSADDTADMVENPARVARVHTHKPWRDGRKSHTRRRLPRHTVRCIRRAFRPEQYWNTS